MIHARDTHTQIYIYIYIVCIYIYRVYIYIYSVYIYMPGIARSFHGCGSFLARTSSGFGMSYLNLHVAS